VFEAAIMLSLEQEACRVAAVANESNNSEGAATSTDHNNHNNNHDKSTEGPMSARNRMTQLLCTFSGDSSASGGSASGLGAANAAAFGMSHQHPIMTHSHVLS
jgi:hypothetical protein